MHRILFTTSLVLLSTLIAVNSQQQQPLSERPVLYTQNPCTSKTTCSSCIQIQKCAWCMQEDFGDRPRCFLPDLLQGACLEPYVVNPDNEIDIKSDYALTKGQQAGGGHASGGTYEEGGSESGSVPGHGSSEHGSSGSGHASGSGRVTQIRPQQAKLKLRINEKYSMRVSYSQAEDYPVDLYYLMDLSKSMEDDKDKLSSLGDTLSETMNKITSNFRLGFGSFVDKVLMPYVSTVPKKLEHPCDGCEAPYGFKNHMSLSVDTKNFSENVKNAHVSGNLDAPEGGFDAIMQAVVCKDEIGWRDHARRLLVFSTDAGFHYAGDGKLGGVITPNDGICHMEANQYTHSTIQDYPSISQINLKVKEKSINIIFAVTQSQHEVYKKLSEHVEGSSSAILSENSDNVVDLVRDEYNKITSSVEMKDTAQGHVKVTYWSSCKNGTRRETNKCDGLKVGDVVDFDVEIVVTQCPADAKDQVQTFTIYPVGVGEALTIDLEMICSCDCESKGVMFKKDAEQCNRDGTFACGICECKEGFFGRKCECNNNNVGTLGEDFNKCRSDNMTDIECSGRGNCICGQCHCNARDNPEEQISGQFCECDNFSCDRHDSKLCSGPERGSCECGTCKCFDGWSGNACECSNSKASCMSPYGLECSNHGKCNCGKCECDSTPDFRYSGKYCEKCPTCRDRCEEFKYCVECQMYKKGPLKALEDCAKNCTLFVPISVENVDYVEENDEFLCMSYDEDDCRYRFVYNETVDNDKKVIVHVRAQENPECPPKVFLLGIVLGVIAAIVLIGLAMLLLWKLLTTIHDRREFARFEKERMMAKWDTGENPIYKQATSTFKNPTYAGK